MKEPARWRDNPFVLALVGLALMLGGWKASAYLPFPGRIGFGAGLFLFIAAGVLMCRPQPPALTDEEPEVDLDEERESEVY
jgi:hypothetical protein